MHRFQPGDYARAYSKYTVIRGYGDNGALVRVIKAIPFYADPSYKVEFLEGYYSGVETVVFEHDLIPDLEAQHIYDIYGYEHHGGWDKNGIKNVLEQVKETNMNLLANLFLDDDTKSLVEAGILGSDLVVRDQAFVMNFIVQKYKAEMAEMARKTILKKEETKKSK